MTFSRVEQAETSHTKSYHLTLLYLTLIRNRQLPGVFYTVMDRVKDMLDKNIPLRSGTWNIEEVAKINELIPMAITLKPIVYLVNLDSKSFKRKGNKWLVPINEWVNAHGGGIIIPMSVEWEQGLWNVKGDPAAKEAYLAETAGCKSALPRIVKVGYNALNLQVGRPRSVFTTSGIPIISGRSPLLPSPTSSCPSS